MVAWLTGPRLPYEQHNDPISLKKTHALDEFYPKLALYQSSKVPMILVIIKAYTCKAVLSKNSELS